VDSARRWLAAQSGSPRNRVFALVVHESGGTATAQDSTRDFALLSSRIEALRAMDSRVQPDSIEAHFEAIESVVEKLLAMPGDRDLVCFLGAEIGSGLSRPLLRRTVRFLPSAADSLTR
jgi:hypothetical protein